MHDDSVGGESAARNSELRHQPIVDTIELGNSGRTSVRENRVRARPEKRCVATQIGSDRRRAMAVYARKLRDPQSRMQSQVDLPL